MPPAVRAHPGDGGFGGGGGGGGRGTGGSGDEGTGGTGGFGGGGGSLEVGGGGAGMGGAIFNWGGQVTLINSTLSSNDASAAIGVMSGAAQLAAARQSWFQGRRDRQ